MTRLYISVILIASVNKVVSTSLNKQGGFVFKLKDTLKQGLYKIGLDKQNAATIILGKETDIYVTSDYGLLKSNVLYVANSPENEAYKKLLSLCNRMQKKMIKINDLKNKISKNDPFIKQKINVIDENIRGFIQDYNVDLFTIQANYPETFTSEALIKLSLLPQLIDFNSVNDRYDNEIDFLQDYYFEYIDFSDERIIRTPLLADKYNTYLTHFIQHSSEELKDSVDIILNKASSNSTIYDFTVQFLIDIFNKRGHSELEDYIIDKYTDGCDKPLSERTVQTVEKLKSLRVGRKAPEIISTDSDGNTISLTSLIKKNRVLMVYFWASWCEACKVENPNIINIYNKFKEKGFGVYGVALDSNKAEWLFAINKYKFPWANVSDLTQWESEAAKTYNVNHTPTIYLLDNNGIIIDKDLRGDSLGKKLEEMLN